MADKPLYMNFSKTLDNEKVIQEISLMSGNDLMDKNIVYRKLAGTGLIAAANLILMMPQLEFEQFILSVCKEIKG